VKLAVHALGDDVPANLCAYHFRHTYATDGRGCGPLLALNSIDISARNNYALARKLTRLGAFWTDALTLIARMRLPKVRLSLPHIRG